MEPIYGIHLGLVISDGADPEGRNRIQVWIPHLSNTLYKSINSKLIDPKFNGGKDLVIKSPSDLNAIDPNILKTLKTTLPWAEYGAPLFGGSSGNFNNATGITSTTNTAPFPNNSYIAPISISAGGSDLNYGANKGDEYKSSQNNSSIPIRTTHYSLGTSVGGPDPYSNPTGQYPDPYTNLGLTATGKNLGVGIVGSTIPGVNKGDIVQRINPITGVPEVYYVGDTATAEVSKGRIDIYTSPTNWQSTGSAWNLAEQEPDVQNWTVVGNVGKLGSYDAVLSALENYKQYGQIPNGQSSQEGLASLNQNNDQQNPLQNSGPRGVTILNRSGAYAKEDNIGTAGSAVGTFTTPNAGSKVWVFFMGGDVQRPVYFAQAVNKGDVTAVTG
jgi:hypothetical protein